MDKILQTFDLTKEYEKGLLAVNKLNLEIEQGEVYGMLGANGAGKTTTVNLLFNFIQPTNGKIFVNGINVVNEPLKAKMHMAFVSENVMLYGNFTAIQNLDFFSNLGKENSHTKDDYQSILNYVGLPLESHNRRLKTFSKGMRQKCGIAIAIAKDAKIIVLDEPTSGLDPKSGNEFLNILEELKNKGKSIFMTSHDIFRTKEIADKVGIMKNGELIKELTKQQLLTNNLEKIYLDNFS